jgi:hypothetical protein
MTTTWAVFALRNTYLALAAASMLATFACGSHKSVCGGVLELDTSSISVNATAGGADPAPKTFHVSNPSCEGMYCLPTQFTASSDSPWLTVGPQQGTVGANDVTLTVSVTVGNLAAGTYTGHVSVAAASDCSTPALVPVTLTIAASAAATQAFLIPRVLP